MNIIERYNEFLRRYTYRQRFVFWSFLYFAAVPFPNYWIIDNLNRHINLIDQQQEGVREKRWIWKISDNLLLSAVNQGLSYERIDNSDFDVLTLKMHLLSEAYHLYTQDDELKNELTQIVNYSIWQDQVSVVQLKRAANNIMAKKAISEKFLARTSGGLTAFRSHFEETIGKLISLYQYVNHQYPTIEMPFVLDMEKVEESRLKNVQYADVVKKILSTVQDKELGAPISEVDLNNIAAEAIRAMSNCRYAAVGVFEALLEEDRKFYWWMRFAVIAAFCLVSFVAMFFVVFHVLTGHLLRLLDYIKELTKGEFPPLIQTNNSDEVGEITSAFYKLGQTAEIIILELQSSSMRLAGLTKKFNTALALQSGAAGTQKESLDDLQAENAVTGTALFELSEIIKGFGNAVRGRSIDNSLQIRLNRMLENMAILANEAVDIVDTLTRVQETILSTRTLSEFMSKTSDQVRLIAINSSIEAASSQLHHQELDDMVLKIGRFADAISESAVRVIRKIDDMAASVGRVKKTAESCAKEISVGAKRSIIIGGQMSNIAQQGDEQFVEVQIVDAILQDLIEEAKCDITIIGQLRESIEKNKHSFKKLEKAASGLDADIQELCSLTLAFRLKVREEE